MSALQPSPLDVLDDAAGWLIRGPAPLVVHGGDIGEGLPAREIRVEELRAMLLHPSAGLAVRDAALRVLIGRARSQGPAWVVALAWVLQPGLRRIAGRLARDYHGDTADLDAEVLAGLLEGLDRLDAACAGLTPRLLWAAYRRGARLRDRELAARERCRDASERTAARPPGGHPDLLLAEAVASGALTAEEAGLISATRLDDVTVVEVAAAVGMPYDRLQRRRRRAEQRLAAWLTER